LSIRAGGRISSRIPWENSLQIVYVWSEPLDITQFVTDPLTSRRCCYTILHLEYEFQLICIQLNSHSAISETGTLIRKLTPRALRATRLLSDESGAAATLAAVMLPVVIGGMGLGAEVGLWYFKDRQLQHAADLSAHAAGTRKRAGDSQEAMRQAALNIAVKTGFLESAGTLTILTPPTTGANAGNQDAVEVRLSRQLPRLFSKLFSNEPVSLNARAVAIVRDGNEACVLALSPTASGAVTVSGSTLVDLNGCDVASNSMASDSILMKGASASLEAGCVYAVGEIVDTTRLTLTECDDVREYAPISADPYASVAEPADIASVPVSTQDTGLIEATYSYASGVEAMRFSGGLTLTGTVEFGPGLYIIDGGPSKSMPTRRSAAKA
jgi:Flp pilus assembly protein TadG